MTDQQTQSITNDLRRLVTTSDATLYRIAKDSGVPHTTLQTFASGSGLTGVNIDKLARYFGVRLTKPRA